MPSLTMMTIPASLLRLFFATGLLVSLACAGPGSFPGVGRAPLRVGVSPDYPPVIFEKDGEIVGIEADLARLIGTALGRPIEFERYAFPELLDALLRSEVDVVMSGLSITPERAERVRFITPYMQIGQLALIRTQDIAKFGRIQNIRRPGVRVGFQRASSGERFVATTLHRATSFAFENVEDGLRSLRAGRIDYFIHDAPTVWRVAGDIANRDLHGLYRPLTEEDIAWAVRPDDSALAAVLDATIAHWKREGLIDPIVQRWIPVRVTLR